MVRTPCCQRAVSRPVSTAERLCLPPFLCQTASQYRFFHMAIFPQGQTQVEHRCKDNPGERRVFAQLKRCLSDDYWVWHNTPIGPRALQPDFVILSPRQGVLVLEVKGWKPFTLVEANRDAVVLNTPTGRTTQANPLRQARDYCMALANLMQQDPALIHHAGPFAGNLLFPYGWGVAFSHMRSAEVAGSEFFDLFPFERALLRDDLDEALAPEAFQARLWGMFTVSYPHTLSEPQRDRIRWHLFPEIRMPSAQAGLALLDEAMPGSGPATPFAPHAPDLLQVMDLQQEQLARSLGEGHRVIHGAAGSGKTMILIFRAHQLAAAARPEQPVLVLCYNRLLADRIRALLHERGVEEPCVLVRTLHAWSIETARQHSLPVPTLGLVTSEDYDRVVAAVAQELHTEHIPNGRYTTVLVDEAHDFEDDWLRMLPRLVNPSSKSLLVLYDDAQSIYQKQRRNFNFASVGIQARGRSTVLGINYRNTAEVWALSRHCAQRLLSQQSELDMGALPPPALMAAEEPPAYNAGVRPASAGRRGPLPVLIAARHRDEEALLLAERMVAAANAGRAWSDMLVLCRAKYLMAPIEQALRAAQVPFQSMNAEHFRRFDWERPSVKLMTMHSAKGLKFPLVFVAGLQALPTGHESFDEAVRLLYVAMTRATHELVLSAAGRSAVVEQVRHSLLEVTAKDAYGTGGAVLQAL